MAKSESELSVYFAGLEASAQPPAAALYIIGKDDLPDRKLGTVINGTLKLEGNPPKGAQVAFGPDVKTPATIDPESLLRYRFDEVIDGWRERGILLPQDRWTLLLREIVCVSGRVRKCRPWFFDRIASPIATLSQQSFAQRSLALQLSPVQGFAELLYPRWCVPLCDGIVEVYERKCCCHHFHIDHLLDRLRDLLERVPIDIDWPVPPEPEPWGPLLDRVALNPQPLPPVDGPKLRAIAKRSRPVVAEKRFDPGQTYVSERVLEDYQALRTMPRAETAAYIEARPYLYAHICTCTMKKVGQVAIQPDGEFDFCYWRPRHFHHLHHHHHHHCHSTYAYRVKQLINGIWTVVYDGVAGNDYYGQGERAEIRTTSPKARPCGQGPKPPHEGDGLPYVILQNVTGQYTNHFNFPLQTGVSQVGAIGASTGLYDFGGVDDCPWAQTLQLRLWSSPQLKDIVVYYRLKVAKVNAAGQPVGGFQTLKNAVTWQRHDGGQKTTESLAAAPSDVGGEDGLYKFPYEGDGKNWFWVDYHQSWDTTIIDPDGGAPAEAVLDGHYMLVLEVFGPGGTRLRPNSSAGGPGNPAAFQFRRWTDPDDTVNVPFADCAHIFRVNNEAIVGDIVDLRKDGIANNAECQFMSGTAATEFSLGFRAYHSKGVTTGGGVGDTNSFLRHYSIHWQRGLNGPQQLLESGATDQGELAVEQSNAATFGTMLGTHARCTFSAHLNVYGKHHNGGSFLYGNGFYYNETASFALAINS